MNRFALACAVLAIASLSYAQFGPEPKYDAAAVSALVDKVHSDLDHAYRTRHFSHDDRDRLNRAEKELREFAQKWERGKFDKDQLDDAIASIQYVLDDNKMSTHERDAVSDDVTQLRRMRDAHEHHEIEGDRH